MSVKAIPGKAKAVTKHDTNYLTDLAGTSQVSGVIYVGGAGVVNVLPVGHDDTNTAASGIQFTVPAGGYVPVEVKKVFSTSTTATDMVCLFD